MNKLKIKKSAILSFLSVFLYRIALDLSYYFVISKVWAYTHFELYFSSIKLIESYFLLFVIFILMPKSSKKLSDIIIWLLVLISYVPMLTLFAFRDESRIYMYAITSFWILVFLLLHMPRLSLPSLKKTQAKLICYFLFITLTTTIIFLIYKYIGFSFNFNLAKVYEIRSQYVSTNIPLAGYIFTWLALVVNPMFFVMFLGKKKWFYVAIIIFTQLLLFSVTGNRIYLFTLPFIYILIRIITSRHSLAYMSLGLFSVIVFGILSYFVFGDLWITSLFASRTLMDPALLSFLYYDFFSNNDYTYLSSNRIFRSFIDYPYHLDPPHLIGEVYYDNPKANANNGIFSDAYMNFGFLGLILWAILLVFFLKIADSFSKGKDIKVGIGALGISAIVFTNVPLLTSLFTNGMLLGLILVYLLPKTSHE